MLDIKRCIEEFKPEGFRIEKFKGGINFWVPDNTFFSDVQIDIKNNKWVDLCYPLFPQRVIEGINRSQTYSNSSFIQNDYAIEAYREDLSWETFNFVDYDSIDQAKEQAIQYILDNLAGK